VAFVKLNITGMSCDDCAISVRQALNTLPGASALVSFPRGEAQIETTGETDMGQLLNAVESKGYGTSIQTVNGDTEKDTGDSKLKIAILKFHALLKMMRLRPSRIHLYHTLSLSDSLEPFVVNTLITPSSGMLRTLSENLQTSGNTTTVIEFINR